MENALSLKAVLYTVENLEYLKKDPKAFICPFFTFLSIDLTAASLRGLVKDLIEVMKDIVYDEKVSSCLLNYLQCIINKTISASV